MYIQAKQEEEQQKAADEAKRRQEAIRKREEEAAQRRYTALSLSHASLWSLVMHHVCHHTSLRLLLLV